jgi:rubredoxin-NAD+ reductase
VTAPVVIVGAGLAGFNVARALRKRDASVPIVVVTADGGDYYSKPMLSNALTLKKDAGSLVLSARDAIAQELGVAIRAQTRVERIDAARREIFWEGGGERYASLVLAMGADPVNPRFEGDGAGEVFHVNDLAGYARWRSAIGAARRVVVVGAGLVGCEFANDLAAAGVEVTVVDMLAMPLARMCPPECATALRDALSTAGVRWRLRCGVRAIDRHADGLRVELADGEAIACDAVLVAIGLRARTALAREAGLAVAAGIVVDAHLETSVPGIYAIGDCAEQDGRLRPFVMPITVGAKPLAATLAGCRTRVAYPPMPIVVKTPACPVTILPPDAGVAGTWSCEGRDRDRRALFHDGGGVLRGFALAGDATRERQRLVREIEAAEAMPSA